MTPSFAVAVNPPSDRGKENDMDKTLRDFAAGQANPVSDYENAAMRWSSAKERLDEACAEAERAGIALAQSREAEQAAWLALQDAAGRGPKPAAQGPIDKPAFIGLR